MHSGYAFYVRRPHPFCVLAYLPHFPYLRRVTNKRRLLGYFRVEDVTAVQRRNGGGVCAFVACVTRCEEALGLPTKGEGEKSFSFRRGAWEDG